MMNKEELNNAAATLERKAAAGEKLLSSGTREAVKVSEVNALLHGLSEADNKQEALIEALMMMYHAGANAGGAIERRARRTRKTNDTRRTGGTTK